MSTFRGWCSRQMLKCPFCDQVFETVVERFETRRVYRFTEKELFVDLNETISKSALLCGKCKKKLPRGFVEKFLIEYVI